MRGRDRRRLAYWKVTAVSAMLVAATPASVRAQYGARAAVDDTHPGGSTLDASVAATEIDLENRVRVSEGLDEVVAESPGARARRLGTLSGASFLSLRGAEAVHTRVLFGESSLDSVMGTPFDLSLVPVALLSRVEVLRGGAPAWLATNAVGGVLRLVPLEARGRSMSATLFAGSFGARALRLSARTSDGRIEWATAASLEHDDGDFRYHDDGGTAFDRSDDRERTRTNAAATRGAIFTRIAFLLAGGRLTLASLAVERTAGVPGPAVQPTRDTHRTETRALASARWERGQRARGRFSAELAASLERNRFTDLYGEIGMGPRATDDLGMRLSARAALEHPLASWLALTAVTSAATSRFVPHDVLSAVAADPSKRNELGATVEARVHGHLSDVRLEVRPSLGLGWDAAELVDVRPERIGMRSSPSHWLPSARLGLVVEPLRELAFVASLSRTARSPSLVELFGDRGFLVGSASLRPELGWSADIGIASRFQSLTNRASFEARAFATALDDAIVYVRTSQFTVVPQNLASARTVGAELETHGELARMLAWTASLTWMHTRGANDRALPLRPSLAAYARPEVTLPSLGPISALRLFVDVAYVGASFVDVANLVPLDARFVMGLGLRASFAHEHIELAATVRDVLDARGTDVLGFPLPGRSLMVSLSVREGGARR